jgi:hypothetical protein
LEEDEKISSDPVEDSSGRGSMGILRKIPMLPLLLVFCGSLIQSKNNSASLLTEACSILCPFLLAATDPKKCGTKDSIL